MFSPRLFTKSNYLLSDEHSHLPQTHLFDTGKHIIYLTTLFDSMFSVVKRLPLKGSLKYISFLKCDMIRSNIYKWH